MNFPFRLHLPECISLGSFAFSLLLGLLPPLDASAQDGHLPVWKETVFAGYLPTFRSGDVLAAQGVFAVRLEPGAPYAGAVTFEALPAGRYVVVASLPARLGLIRHVSLQPPVSAGDLVFSSPFEAAEIALDGGPVTLEITGVTEPTIGIALIRLRY